MKLIRSLWVSFLIYYRTKKTHKWILSTYSKLCELQFEDWALFDGFRIKAYGTYFEFHSSQTRFAINEVKDGISCNVMDDKEKWNRVFESKNMILEYDWIRCLELVNINLNMQNVYYERAKELKDEPQWA